MHTVIKYGKTLINSIMSTQYTWLKIDKIHLNTRMK